MAVKIANVMTGDIMSGTYAVAVKVSEGTFLESRTAMDWGSLYHPPSVEENTARSRKLFAAWTS